MMADDRPEADAMTSIVLFASGDKEFGEKLTQELANQGMTAVTSLMFSKQEYTKVFLKSYFDQSKAAVCVLSNEFLCSKQCYDELAALESGGKKILAVRFEKHDRIPTKYAKCFKVNPVPMSPLSVFDTDFAGNMRELRSNLLQVGVKPKSGRKAARKSVSPSKPTPTPIATKVVVSPSKPTPTVVATKAAVAPTPDRVTQSETSETPPLTKWQKRNLENSQTSTPQSQPKKNNFVRKADSTPMLLDESFEHPDEDPDTPLPPKPNRLSVFVSAGGKVVVDGAQLTRQGSGMASAVTQSLVRTHSAKNNAKWNNDYQVLMKLGSGMFGVVSKVKHKVSGALYAMKAINFSGLKGERLLNLYLSLREIELMKKMDHPNIIKIYEIYKSDDDTNLIMELCTGGELGDWLHAQPMLPAKKPFPSQVRRFDMAQARNMTKNMLTAVHYLHINGIVHRDIKVENFIFAGPAKGQGLLKLIDFGLSRPVAATESMTTMVGSQAYKAPEVGSGTPYTENSDLWSIGVVVHMLVTGVVPWQGNTAQEIYDSVMQETADPTAFKEFLQWFHTSFDVSPECNDFIMELMNPAFKTRISAEKALAHPWLTNGSVGKGAEGKMRQAHERRSLDLLKDTNDAVGYQVASNLAEFAKKGALKRSAMLALTFTMNGAQLEEIGNAFKAADTNGDGLISRSEFAELMKSQGVPGTQIRPLFDAINQDGSGNIKYSEFVAAAIEESHSNSAQHLEAAFKRLDVKNRGWIDGNDLSNILSKTYGKEAVQNVLMAADSNSDGKIDLEEFKMVWKTCYVWCFVLFWSSVCSSVLLLKNDDDDCRCCGRK